VVISGGVDEIRRKYGNNNVELIYTGKVAIEPVSGVFSVLSDVCDGERHTAVLSISPDSDGNSALKEIISRNVTVNSFKELVPRMNDIFIKLVTEEE
jgi:ABC-2 type transport system ATP-binding protein